MAGIFTGPQQLNFVPEVWGYAESQGRMRQNKFEKKIKNGKGKYQFIVSAGLF